MAAVIVDFRKKYQLLIEQVEKPGTDRLVSIWSRDAYPLQDKMPRPIVGPLSRAVTASFP